MYGCPSARKRSIASSVGDLGALEGLIGLDVSRHPLLDSLQVRLGGPEPIRELEVVVEAVLDRGADRDLGARPQVEHRGGQHVGAVVAKDLEGLGPTGVRISIRSPSASGAARSRTWPSTLTASASSASRGPIAAAASAPVAPCSSSRADSSGSFTVSFAIAGHATYEGMSARTGLIARTLARAALRAAWGWAGVGGGNRKSSCDFAIYVNENPQLAGSGPSTRPVSRPRVGPLADRDQRTGPVPPRGRLGSPQHVGPGASSEPQAGERAAAARSPG